MGQLYYKLHMRMLRQRGLSNLPQNHTGKKWESQDLNSGSLFLEPTLSPTKDKESGEGPMEETVDLHTGMERMVGGGMPGGWSLQSQRHRPEVGVIF